MGARLQDRAWWPIPGELDVALVTEHGDVTRPTPLGRRLEVVDLAGGISRRVHPQRKRSPGIVLVDRRQVDTELVVDGHRNRATAREDRAHLISRIRERWVEDRVAIGRSKFQVLGQARNELLRADAGRHLVDRDLDPEPTLHPSRCGLAQRGRPDRSRIPAFGVRPRESLDHLRRRRVTRRTDAQVDDAALVGGGDRL